MRVHRERGQITFERGPTIGCDRLVKIIQSRDCHRWHGKKERKFERRRARETGHLASRDGAHRPRRAGKNRGQNLNRADPGRLRQTHFLHVSHTRPRKSCIDNPHDNTAKEQRPRNNVKVFKIFSDLLFKRPRW